MLPKAPPVYKPGANPPRVAAPPVYRPQQTSPASVQPKSAGHSRIETRPAPPVYRPQQSNGAAQPKSIFPIHPIAAPAVHSASQAAQPLQMNAVNRVGNAQQRINIGMERPSNGAGLVQKKNGPMPMNQASASWNAPRGVLQPKPQHAPGPITVTNFGLPRPAAVQTLQRSHASMAAPVFQPNLSVLQLSKRGRGGKKKDDEDDPEKRRIFTRILHPDQLKRKNIGIKSVRRSERSLRRNLPREFTPFGSNTSAMSGLFSFMRKYGGAGYMGFHTDPGGELTRAQVVGSVLSKMRSKRQTRSSRGPKFAIVAIDASQLNAGSMQDLTRPATRRSFLREYPNFSSMYDNHAEEGVVAIGESIPRDAVIALRAFRDVPTEEELQKILDQLMAEAELDEHESAKQPGFRKDDFDPSGNGGGWSSTGVEVS